MKLHTLVVAGLVATLILLTGCTTSDTRPYMAGSEEASFMVQCLDEQYSERQMYGIGGAAAGALVGTLADRKRFGVGTLLGAVVGAAAGYYVGKHFDEQACRISWLVDENEALRHKVDVAIDQRNSAIVLTGSSDVMFETDSDTVRPAFRELLDGVGVMMMRDQGIHAHVVGHADSRGDEGYNMALSERRARAVAYELQAYSGNVTSEGRGEEFPVASNATPEGRKLNRRVDIELLVSS